MGSRHHEPEPPDGRAADRRRQFEDSRGLTDPRELPLEDESADEEPEAEPGDGDQVSPSADGQGDDQE